MPRGYEEVTEGLAGNRLDQRSHLRRLGHKLRAPIMPSTKQFLPGDIYAGHIAEVNDQRSIADQVVCQALAAIRERHRLIIYPLARS